MHVGSAHPARPREQKARRPSYCSDVSSFDRYSMNRPSQSSFGRLLNGEPRESSEAASPRFSLLFTPRPNSLKKKAKLFKNDDTFDSHISDDSSVRSTSDGNGSDIQEEKQFSKQPATSVAETPRACASLQLKAQLKNHKKREIELQSKINKVCKAADEHANAAFQMRADLKREQIKNRVLAKQASTLTIDMDARDKQLRQQSRQIKELQKLLAVAEAQIRDYEDRYWESNEGDKEYSIGPENDTAGSTSKHNLKPMESGSTSTSAVKMPTLAVEGIDNFVGFAGNKDRPDKSAQFLKNKQALRRTQPYKSRKSPASQREKLIRLATKSTNSDSESSPNTKLKLLEDPVQFDITPSMHGDMGIRKCQVDYVPPLSSSSDDEDEYDLHVTVDPSRVDTGCNCSLM